MLREIRDVKQVPGEPRRRWFSDENYDLIVWIDPADQLLGFQLCYDKGTRPKALTWLNGDGYRHSRIDDGDNPGKMKSTPLLEANGPFDSEDIARRFVENKGDVPEKVADCVYDRIKSFRGPVSAEPS